MVYSQCEHKVQDKLQSNEQNVRKESLPCTSENVCRLLIDSQISCNFRVLGSQLGLDPPDLDIIEHYPIEQHLIKIICLCFQRGQLTWSGIIQTLKKPSLKLYSSANYIESRVQAEPLISETHGKLKENLL